MTVDVKTFEKKLDELRVRRLENIDKIYSLETIKDVAKMFYEAGLSEAKAAIILAMTEGDKE